VIIGTSMVVMLLLMAMVASGDRRHGGHGHSAPLFCVRDSYRMAET
jgi:hypothetical protein